MMNPAVSQPSPSRPLLVLISAPSGAGKTTLCLQLLAARPEMARVVTCTTRPPRTGEVDGKDYYFLSLEAFRSRVAAGDFLEHATVYGNHYGTLRSEVLEKLRRGRDVLLNVDVQGARSVRDRAADHAELRAALVSIFLTPPSIRVLEQRLLNRATDAPEVVERRLRAAREEIACWRDFDYLLISATIAEDLRRALTIVEAEKMRTGRSVAPEL